MEREWHDELRSVLAEWGKNAPAVATLIGFFEGVMEKEIQKAKKTSYRRGYKAGHAGVKTTYTAAK